METRVRFRSTMGLFNQPERVPFSNPASASLLLESFPAIPVAGFSLPRTAWQETAGSQPGLLFGWSNCVSA